VSRAARRYYRTILLGTAAMGALVWAAVDQFGIPWEEMLELFLWTLLVAGLVIALAGLLVGAWIGVRKLLQKDSRSP
jgi:peptidoglycan biosynthesis protein MviN/MurJ (putative lipid II flippase)